MQGKAQEPLDGAVDSSPPETSRMTERQRAKEAADAKARLAAEAASQSAAASRGKKARHIQLSSGNLQGCREDEGITWRYSASRELFAEENGRQDRA